MAFRTMVYMMKANIPFLSSKAVCFCSQVVGRSSIMPHRTQEILGRYRSGKCTICRIVLDRGGRRFGVAELPERLVSVVDAHKRFSHVRGYLDGDIPCRLLILRTVAKFTLGLTHEEEVKLAARAYTQFALENDILVDDPGWIKSLYRVPCLVVEYLVVIMKNQLGPSYVSHMTSEMQKLCLPELSGFILKKKKKRANCSMTYEI
ncbi:uncharacterized protein F4822DRAFT_193730 [Hypoxylon trugodes]|uniref:uncharacterized protein n=1 Tax=Hypoxylon trugodes TaxID=326681 RepID=UPI00219142F5|nr:uncharacterized protein F4822DRAFT_193730 [Hypoxylon trugodes]KAI1391722.1 hypothetical protein F4822DRAFT_193730 [Hypoxylon trugodes]